MKQRENKAKKHPNQSKTGQKLNDLGFHQSIKKFFGVGHNGTVQEHHEPSGQGDKESKDWARFSQEAEECRRNGAFSYRED